MNGCSSDARKDSTFSGSDAPRFVGFGLVDHVLRALATRERGRSGVLVLGELALPLAMLELEILLGELRQDLIASPESHAPWAERLVHMANEVALALQ